MSNKSGIISAGAVSIYPRTRTKSVKSKNKIYALGRVKYLDGLPKEAGGYALFALSGNYAGNVRGGISYSWKVVKEDLSYTEAVQLINRRVGYTAFTVE